MFDHARKWGRIMNYVGIVLVSHSSELVSGLKKLLIQVAPQVPIAVAGGTNENEIGTSAEKIKEAIESVYSAKGVAVFVDLGSALMNTELALEWLEGFDNIKIVDAPIVEGAYAGAVASGMGCTLESVLYDASEAKNLVKI